MVSSRRVSIIVSAVLLGALLLLLAAPSAGAASKEQQRQGAKLIRVGSKVQGALTQAANQNGELLSSTRRAGRCWGATASSADRAGRMQEGQIIHDYALLSQRQANYQALRGTVGWARGVLQAAQPPKLTVGSLRTKQRPRQTVYRALRQSYQTYLDELRPVPGFRFQENPCLVIEAWAANDFRGAWQLVSEATGVASVERLRSLAQTHIAQIGVRRQQALSFLLREKVFPAKSINGVKLQRWYWGPYIRTEKIYFNNLVE